MHNERKSQSMLMQDRERKKREQTQYELRTRRLPQRRATRSSAVERSERWNLSWLTPWLVGLPYVAPFRGQSQEDPGCQQRVEG